MQKTLKILALLFVILALSSCALFKRKPVIVPVDERTFIVEALIKDVNVDGTIITLVNPYFPNDKAIIMSGEKFKKVIGSSIETITEKEEIKKRAVGI